MKLYEFLNNNNNEIKDDIDSFIFFDEKWMFVENVEFIKSVINYIDVDKFIEIGLKICEKLNDDKIDPRDYDKSILSNYLK